MSSQTKTPRVPERCAPRGQVGGDEIDEALARRPAHCSPVAATKSGSPSGGFSIGTSSGMLKIAPRLAIPEPRSTDRRTSPGRGRVACTRRSWQGWCPARCAFPSAPRRGRSQTSFSTGDGSTAVKTSPAVACHPHESIEFVGAGHPSVPELSFAAWAWVNRMERFRRVHG